jgi:hypothetical protein
MTGEDDALRAESSQIEQLLDELRSLVAAPAFQRVEDVIGRIVRMYGAGIARAVGHARSAGVDDHRYDQLCCDDDLLASLLLLHGLHPRTTAQRIDAALTVLCTELGLPAGALVLESITDGRVTLRASGSLGGGAMASRVAEGIVHRVVEAAAPEVSAIEIAGLPVPRDTTLVQIRTRAP